MQSKFIEKHINETNIIILTFSQLNRVGLWNISIRMSASFGSVSLTYHVTKPIKIDADIPLSYSRLIMHQIK